jgi:hypothetical protein
MGMTASVAESEETAKGLASFVRGPRGEVSRSRALETIPATSRGERRRARASTDDARERAARERADRGRTFGIDAQGRASVRRDSSTARGGANHFAAKSGSRAEASGARDGEGGCHGGHCE